MEKPSEHDEITASIGREMSVDEAVVEYQSLLRKMESGKELTGPEAVTFGKAERIIADERQRADTAAMIEQDVVVSPALTRYYLQPEIHQLLSMLAGPLSEDIEHGDIVVGVKEFRDRFGHTRQVARQAFRRLTKDKLIEDMDEGSTLTQGLIEHFQMVKDQFRSLFNEDEDDNERATGSTDNESSDDGATEASS